MWAYLVRYPGLVVLHDGQLHHARGRLLIRQRRNDDYVSEFMFDDPMAAPGLAEIGIAGLLGSLTYLWPMRRAVVESARFVVVHNRALADQVLEESPGVPVAVVEMGVPDPGVTSEARQAIRARHGIPPSAVVFTAFGNVTPEKRIPQAIRALSALSPTLPDIRLLLVGESVDHYDARREAEALGVGGHVTVAGFVPHDEVAAYLAASDVCLSMRWPTSRETSAAWLRAVAAGLPTIVTDLAHNVDIPALDPRGWSLLHAPSDASDGARPAGSNIEPVCLSIDILDEDHSLRLAMRRLATDAHLRSSLGSSARRLWTARFRLDQMVSRYRHVIERADASELPGPSARANLPKHFLVDGTEHTRDLLRRTGLADDRINSIWSSNPTSPASSPVHP
jgi:glycosyltransferase involved in cell wall biosynthesis